MQLHASRSPRRLPEIEVLRALAVIGVVIHHSHGNLVTGRHRMFDWLQAHAHFWTGVDLFFAISGFVIARSLLPSLAQCRGVGSFITTAAAFWIRRAWRLLPSAWLWLVVCLALSAGFNRSGVFMSVQANAWALLAGVFDYANVRFGLAFMRYDYGASFAWWSLSLEEQFYLVLPPLAFLCGRYLPILLIPVVVLQFGLVRSALLTVFRTDAILLGVLLACWEGHRSFPLIGAQIGRLRAALRIALVAVLLVCLGVLGTLNLSFNRFTLGEIALVSAALVYLAAQNTGLLLGEGALRRLMVAIGARSYALYLVHIPAFFAAREIWFRIGGQHGDLPVVLTGAALLLVGAELNWRFVEQPLRARGTRIAAGFVARRTA